MVIVKQKVNWTGPEFREIFNRSTYRPAELFIFCLRIFTEREADDA